MKLITWMEKMTISNDTSLFKMEGQKLINKSLVMGIEVGKSSAINQNTKKFLPSS